MLHSLTGKHRFTAQIDSASNVNLIDVFVAKENGLQYTNAVAPTMTAINGTPVHVYGEVKPTISFEGLGQSGPEEHRFLVVNLPQYDFILGGPWLYDVDPLIGWKTGEWRLKYKPERVEVVLAAAFAEDVKTSPVYAFLPTIRAIRMVQGIS
jgi:hypothetical protein